MWKLLLLTAVYTVSSVPTCPGGSTYNSNFKSCYKFINDPKAYSDAEQNCVKDGGHLVSIRSEAENAFIADLAQSSSNPGELYYWIGSPKGYYTKWASGQYNLTACSALTPCGGLWAKVDCTFTAPFACRMEPFNCPDCPTCPVPHSYCDSTWTYLGESDSCYKGFFDATWDEAEATCQSYGSHLTSIHSDAENNFIFDLVTMGVEKTSYQQGGMTWFGLHRNPPGSANFEFVDGTPYNPNVYNKWKPNEPSHPSENCAEMYSERTIIDDNGQKFNYTELWNDTLCSLLHRRFVCKKPAYHG